MSITHLLIAPQWLCYYKFQSSCTEKLGFSICSLQTSLTSRVRSAGKSIGNLKKKMAQSGCSPVKNLPLARDADLLAKIQAGIANVAAMSLAIKYPTMASVPHSIVNGMKNLQAIAAATEINLKDAEKGVHKQGAVKAQSRCCLLKGPKTGFGVSRLRASSSSTSISSSSSLHPMLKLLGLCDARLQEQLIKDHPYAFNMGNNNIIPLSDFQEATKVLMERNMPDVLHNRQTEAVFMPEAHLPNMPRIVCEERYQEEKANLDKADLQFLEMRKGTEDLQVAHGDLLEKKVLEELSLFYKKSEVVVFHGPKLRLPGEGKGNHQEFDFVIIDLKLKVIIGIESKATLNVRTGQSAAAQTQRLKHLLTEYFKLELASSDWCFVAMVHYNKFELKQPVCSTCSPFTIHGANQLVKKLSDLDTHLKAVRPHWIPSHQEFVSLVKGFSFVVLAHPISTRCTITRDVDVKVNGSQTKVGQGDYKSIIFWTKEQSKVMMWDQKFVVFISPW